MGILWAHTGAIGCIVLMYCVKVTYAVYSVSFNTYQNAASYVLSSSVMVAFAVSAKMVTPPSVLESKPWKYSSISYTASFWIGTEIVCDVSDGPNVIAESYPVV